MDEEDIERILTAALLAVADQDEDQLIDAMDELNEKWGTGIKQVNTNIEFGLLTNNKGVVINLQDRSEFQITIVQSKYGETMINIEEEEHEKEKLDYLHSTLLRKSKRK